MVIRVSVAVPLVAEEDIEVYVEAVLLTVRAEKKEEREIERADQHVTERRFGVFQRSIRLPQSVDAQTVKATLDNGVLQIAIPKSERQTSKRRVAVTTSNSASASESAPAAGQAA